MTDYNQYSDHELVSLIDDNEPLARAIKIRLAGLRAETAKVPDSECGEDQAVRRAAPRLLEALKGVYRWFEGVDELDQQFIEARQAIAQAEGKV